MAEKNKKSQYLSLSDTYLKFRIGRLAVVVTVVLTLYNAINSNNYKTIIDNYNKVLSISDSSWGVPLTNDWFIDGMFINHGMYDSDTVNGLIHSVDKQIDYSSDSVVFTESGPKAISKPIDTAKIIFYKSKQESLLNKITEEIPKIFNLKLSFISDEPLNLQYWIFLLPIIFILSSIYINIIKRKINIVKAELNSENNSITNFEKFPFEFLNTIIQYVELVLLAILIYVYYNLSNNLPGYTKYILFILLYGSYYAIIYFLNISYKLNNAMFQSSRLYIKWNAIYSFVGRRLNKNPFKKLSLTSIILILFTLFLTMSIKGCKREDPFAKKTYFFYHNHSWHKYDNFSFNDNENSIYGYEHIINFNDKVWNFGKEGIVLNRYFQIGYLISIIIAFLFFIALIFKRFKIIKGIVLNKIFYFLFYVASILFLQFSIYYSTYFMPLFIITCFSLIIIFVWIYMNKSKYLHEIDLKTQSKEIFLLTFPFLIILIFKYSQSLYYSTTMIILFTIKSPKTFFWSVWYSINMFSKYIFHFGLFCLMLSLYKQTKEIIHQNLNDNKNKNIR